MINRVTSQTMMATAQRNLASSASLLAQRQSEATTLKAITRPSDNPSGTASLLSVRSQQASADQYGRNIDSGTLWLDTIDSSMTSTTNILTRVRDLTVQGSNGSLNQAGRDAIATELDGLKTQLMDQANTKVMGRSVFAGNSDAALAYTQPAGPAAAPAFAGSGGPVLRRIGTDATVRIDADGASVFGDGSNSVFALVQGVADDLRAGTDVSSRLNAIDDRMKAVSTAHTDVGTRQAQLTKAKDANLQLTNGLEAQRSSLEDLDLGQAVLNLNLQQVNYQAALSVTAKVLPQTLMDFLR